MIHDETNNGESRFHEGSDWQAAFHVDARGLACPLPVLKVRKALSGLASGARVLLETTDPVARIDLPHFCAESGHRLLRQEMSGGVYRFLIERG